MHICYKRHFLSMYWSAHLLPEPVEVASVDVSVVVGRLLRLPRRLQPKRKNRLMCLLAAKSGNPVKAPAQTSPRSRNPAADRAVTAQIQIVVDGPLIIKEVREAVSAGRITTSVVRMASNANRMVTAMDNVRMASANKAAKAVRVNAEAKARVVEIVRVRAAEIVAAARAIVHVAVKVDARARKMTPHAHHAVKDHPNQLLLQPNRKGPMIPPLSS